MLNSARLTGQDIARALGEGEFRAVFQPQFRLQDGAVCGVECFVRWAHPALGLLPPGIFLDLVAREGASDALSRVMLRQALNAAGGHGIDLAINLAPDTLGTAESCAALLGDAAVAGCPPGRLIFEVSEAALADGLAAAMPGLNLLADAGARLALDCHGPQRITLRDAHAAGFRMLKIGGAAIIRFARHTKAAGISAIAQRLEDAVARGFETAAVGVEDDATHAALCELGFGRAQGNHYARPVPASELDALLGELGCARIATLHPAVPAPPDPEPAAKGDAGAPAADPQDPADRTEASAARSADRPIALPQPPDLRPIRREDRLDPGAALSPRRLRERIFGGVRA